MNSSNTFDILKSTKAYSPTSDKKIYKTDQSLISTRDESLYRGFKSTKNFNANIGFRKFREAKQSADKLSMDNIREKMRLAHRSQPKFPKINYLYSPKKVDDGFIREKIAESVVRASSIYLNNSRNHLKSKKLLLKAENESFIAKKSLYEFHSKSKMLLDQLEQRILGDKKTN